MRLTDTHCHLDLDRFENDREEVTLRAREAGVERLLIPGLNLESSRGVVELARRREGFHAAVGVHPTEAGTWNENTGEALRGLIGESNGKIAAVGEIGLDYYWKTAPRDLQKKVLWEQLALAGELGLPVILHFREAGDAPDGECARVLLAMLEDWVGRRKGDGRAGVLHSFAGSAESAKRAIEMGFLIGISGPVTYPKNIARQELAAALPLERMVLETDSPFQAPIPHRGGRNEPAYVRLIADKIALLKSLPLETVANETSRNAAKLFGWEDLS